MVRVADRAAADCGLEETEHSVPGESLTACLDLHNKQTSPLHHYTSTTEFLSMSDFIDKR